MAIDCSNSCSYVQARVLPSGVHQMGCCHCVFAPAHDELSSLKIRCVRNLLPPHIVALPEGRYLCLAMLTFCDQRVLHSSGRSAQVKYSVHHRLDRAFLQNNAVQLLAIRSCIKRFVFKVPVLHSLCMSEVRTARRHSCSAAFYSVCHDTHVM